MFAFLEINQIAYTGGNLTGDKSLPQFDPLKNVSMKDFGRKILLY